MRLTNQYHSSSLVDRVIVSELVPEDSDVVVGDRIHDCDRRLQSRIDAARKSHVDMSF